MSFVYADCECWNLSEHFANVSEMPKTYLPKQVIGAGWVGTGGGIGQKWVQPEEWGTADDTCPPNLGNLPCAATLNS